MPKSVYFKRKTTIETRETCEGTLWTPRLSAIIFGCSFVFIIENQPLIELIKHETNQYYQ